MQMTPQDFTVCKEVLRYLSSNELTAKNYLFLEPVDTNLFTTYLQYVQRPMDLGTVASLLGTTFQSSNYQTVDQFFEDIFLCFQNAVAFHSDKKENSWIVKLAKEMIRITQREKNKISLKKIEDPKESAGEMDNAKTMRQGSSVSLQSSVEDGEIKSVELETAPQISSTMTTDSTNRKEKVVSVIKTNKTQRQSKFKITLPLSKNAPTSKKSSSDTGMETSKISAMQQANRGKQMPSEPGANATTSTIPASAAQPPPKIRFNLGTGGVGGGGKKTEQPKLYITQPEINRSNSDVSVLEQVGGRAPSNVTLKTSKKLPLQSKSSEATSASYTATSVQPSPLMDWSTSFSLGIQIEHIDDLFSTTFIVSSIPMTRAPREQCYKVLSALIRRNSTHSNWFIKPVNDPRLIDDYKAKIPQPMDLGTIGNKLDKNQYATVADFVLDVRRVFANCLRYNSEAANPLRIVAREMLISAEALMIYFLKSGGVNVLPYNPLLSCWRKVIDALDHVLTLNTNEGHLLAHYFLHPPSYYFGGNYPMDYLEKVSTPMDVGTITTKLIEGSYQTVDQIVHDIELIHSNCSSYYKDKDGPERGNTLIIIGQALKVGQILLTKIQPLRTVDRSAPGSKNLVNIQKPPNSILHRVLKELRATSFTDKCTKLSEPATLMFEEPVDLSIFKDYLQYVETPLTLSMIDRKIGADGYRTPEDFEYDVILVFKNCEAYNVPKKNSHIVALARHCIKTFRKLFLTILSSWEESSTKPIADSETSVSLSRSIDLGLGTEPLSKKVKMERNKSFGPRKSLPAMHLTSTSSATSTALSRQTSNLKASNNAPRIKIKLDGPIPLHVAIAQIKDSFPSRRLHKDLESWEGACSRFYRELMRHPWLSATRPKFIFSCPVPILFPELKDAYSAKIVRPMDLTTIECKLLQGGLYKSPQDMTDDVALVFSNAVTFNLAGYQEGEPLSCAYYDVSRHLLRFSRWLSFECFDPYLIDDMHDDGAKQIGPIPSWKLRRSYWKDAKEEMEDIVFNQMIEVRDDGRFTWMDTECEKLLKCLRHQSDYKKMDFFLESTYPLDYSAYISKPMDWKSCEQALQQQKYRTFGEIVGDLRLIFSNALTYNGRAKGTDSVSGRAYDAALYMSNKLEVHINKMLITVSDRLLRERIDDTILGREQQEAEKAEVARLRNEWQQQRERLRSVDSDKRSIDNLTDRSKTSMIRVDNFDLPYYDDEPPSSDLVHQDLASQHRLLLEKQMADRAKMLRTTTDIGHIMYRNMIERSKAIVWAKSLAASMNDQLTTKLSNSSESNVEIKEKIVPQSNHQTSDCLSNKDHIKIKLALKKKPKVSKIIKTPFSLDDIVE